MSNLRVKEGELLKYRNLMYGWKKYYFRLERSYLHYFEGEYNAEPKGTITRGDMAQVTFTKDYQSNFGFEIHLKNGYIWHLKAATHDERMEWMRSLQPDAYIIDPLKVHESVIVNDESQPSAPPQLPDQQPYSSSSYHHIYPLLPAGTIPGIIPGTMPGTIPGTSSMMHGHGGFVARAGPPDSPPPAYDEINNL